jgi:multidrug resistance efflux pump
MTPSPKKAVHVEPMLAKPVRHPIKAAKLLYTTPSYILSAPIYLIFVILAVGIIYAFWAKQDVLVMAPLVLEKDSFTLQATGPGQVTAVAIQENSFVQAGDPLAVIQEQIRPFDNAQRQALESQRTELAKERDKVLSEYEHKLTQLNYDLKDLTNNRGTRITALENQVNNLSKQLAIAHNSKKVAEDSLMISQQQYERIRRLFANRDVTVSERDRALEKLNAAQQAVFDANERIGQTENDLNTAKVELSEFKDLRQQEKIEKEISQTETQRNRDLKRLDEQIQGLTSRLDIATYQEGTVYEGSEARYTSLFDGVITKVHVAPGQMISAGAPLVTIVRDSTVLEGHAFVENKDIGNLKRGQEVKIKYFAYPYQEYGIATGLISSIATTPGGPQGKESMYLINVVLRDDSIRRRGGKAKPLEIGLEGIAEIKTGEKRFIEILFTPISKFFTPAEESA